MNKHINSVTDLLEIIEDFSDYLRGKIPFSDDGWPVFCKNYCLDEWPESVVTFQNRNNRLIACKPRTLLCFYCGDKSIYPRFAKVFDEIPIYKKFLGVVVPDTTVTWDMDTELQNTVMLANQLFAAVLAVNGVKIVFNTRSGRVESHVCFDHIPRNVMWASGFLGCENSTNYRAASVYTNKVLRILPNKLIIYGKEDPFVNEQLDAVGMNYRYYSDFHTVSKRRCG